LRYVTPVEWDLLLEVVDLKQEVQDLRSGGNPHSLTPAFTCVTMARRSLLSTIVVCVLGEWDLVGEEELTPCAVTSGNTSTGQRAGGGAGGIGGGGFRCPANRSAIFILSIYLFIYLFDNKLPSVL